MPRWYRTEDEDSSELVPEGDPRARFLVAGEADEVPEGYDKPKGYKVPERGVDPARPESVEGGAPLAKKASPAANKQRAAADNK
jgi:hypothetical protein